MTGCGGSAAGWGAVPACLGPGTGITAAMPKKTRRGEPTELTEMITAV